jgi:hypothetical protein
MQEDIQRIAQYFDCSVEVLAKATRKVVEQKYEAWAVLQSYEAIIFYCFLRHHDLLRTTIRKIQEFIEENCSERFFFTGHETDFETWEKIQGKYEQVWQ